MERQKRIGETGGLIAGRSSAADGRFDLHK